MKVLVITGDKNFSASPRFALQAAAVEKLAVAYWGRGSIWPVVPKEHFDVITAQDPFWRGLFAWRAARRLRARFNVQVHTDLSAQGWVRHILGQIILRHADTVRVVSEKIKKQVEHMGVRASITVLPVYIDVERFKNIQAQAHSQKTILWMGRFEPEKDPLAAVEVLTQVPGARLIMLGKGSLEGALRAKAHGLAVEFPGWQDPVSYLAAADVVLCTSQHESYGMSIIEALAAGVPVVAPDVGVAKEAGAIIKTRSDLAAGVAEVLRTERRGALKLPLLSAQAWVTEWVKTLA